MQSKSATKKKTTKAAESVTSAVPEELSTASAASNQALSKSSKPKSESSEGGSAKRHRKAANSAPESLTAEPSAPVVAEGIETPEQPVAASAAPVAPQRAGASVPGVIVDEEQVRQLAYQFWMERGQPHGSHHEDWVRAEKVLAAGA